MPSRTASRTLTPSRARSLTLTRYWLSVSDLVSSFVYIVDGATTANEEGSARCPNGGCVLLASLSQVFNLSAIVWNTYIALNMHLTVLRAARIVKDEPRYMHRLHAGAWGTALLSALTTALTLILTLTLTLTLILILTVALTLTLTLTLTLIQP